jgi:NAD(P)-dependent dehydrogenase (short-subunit alcohol dehydrogenase family)
MTKRLEGKTAIVVGAGSIGPGWGNGKATAVQFAREGAAVFCADVDAVAARVTAEIIRGEGGRAEVARVDVSSEADVTAITERCVECVERIDILHDNVGIVHVARAAAFLASEEARYITGIELVIDGGLSLKIG